MPYIAGHFRMAYSNWGGSTVGYTSLGSTESGYELIKAQHQQNVKDDAWGDAIANQIQQGIDYSLRFTYVEYDLFLNAINVQSQTEYATNNLVGWRLTDLAGLLAITPVAGTPAATLLGVGKSIVYTKAILESDIPVLYAAGLRRGPATFRLLPDTGAGNVVGSVINTPAGA